MDKEKNYYSLIESLVKNHRKFPGYEAILDDIVKDVYAHSEVIINSIDNESVIESYLEKVISTSIITVPKKMKFNSEVKHRVISNEPPKDVEIAAPPVSDDKKDEPVAIDNTPVADISESLNNDEVILPEAENLELQEETVTDGNSLPEIEEEMSLGENDTPNDIMSFTQNIGVEKADPNLVDKMINSIGNDELAESLDYAEPSVTEDTEDYSELAEVDELEVLDSEEEAQDFGFESVIEPEADEMLPETNDEVSGIDLNEEEELSVVSEQDELSDTLPESTDEVELQEEVSEDTDFAEIVTETNDESELSEESNDQFVLDESDNITATNELQLDFGESASEDTEIIQPDENISDDTDLVELDIAPETDETDTELLIQEDVPVEILPEPVLEEADVSEEVLNENPETDNNLLDIDGSDVQDLSGDSEIIDLPSEPYDIESSDETALTVTEDLVAIDTDEVLSIDESDNAIIDSDSEELVFVNDLDDEYGAAEPVLDVNTAEETIESDDTEYAESDSDDSSLMQPSSISAKNEHHYVPTDYSVFDYIPDTSLSNIDVKEVTNKLLQLSQENPDLNVLQIFDMKYKQNITISEIAERLGTDKSQVIAVLNKIIELV